MIFWIVAISVAAAAFAALYYAGRARPVNAGGDALRAHHRALLQEIETDHKEGRLNADEATAAKAELAREIVRSQGERGERSPTPEGISRLVLPLAILGIAAVTFVTYAAVGTPDLPAAPLASRPEIAHAAEINNAITQVEARLQSNPDDLRGWQVLAPVYMRAGRYADAVKAYQAILRLSPVTAAAQTDLAEAMILRDGGKADDKAMALLKSAAERDPNDIRSRFYLAGEATRTGDFQLAIDRWKELLKLSKGDEPWLDAAHQGLKIAENGGTAPTAPTAGVAGMGADQQKMIEGMVEGLSARLQAEGGTIEEWTRLVRSRLVLGDKKAAQKAYDDARAAYPDASQRGALDALANENGLS